MQYVSTTLSRKMIALAKSEGLGMQDLNSLPISPDSINSMKAVPAEDFFSLHEALDERLPSGFSVRVGQQMMIEDYGVLGLSWKTCSWAGEIFDRSERYFKLLSDTYLFRVEKGNDISRIYLNRDAHRRGIELSNEATLSATVVVLQEITGSHIRPLKVSFKHGQPEDLSDYKEAFRCEILFGQPANFIEYHTPDLEMRTISADASINQFLLERVDEETNGLELQAHRISADVEMLIRDALPSGIPSIGQIAKHMGMSRRTLSRRLSENEITFRDLIKKVQRSVAERLLLKSGRNIAEISYETGFSEQSAFNRAFKRWTGVSPLQFRRDG